MRRKDELVEDLLALLPTQRIPAILPFPAAATGRLNPLLRSVLPTVPAAGQVTERPQRIVHRPRFSVSEGTCSHRPAMVL